MHKGLRYTPVRASRCAPTLLSRVTVSLVTILFQSMFRAHMGLLSVSLCIVKRCQNALEVFAVSRGWWPGTLWRDPKLGCTHAQCILGSRQNAQGSPVHPGTCFKMCTHVTVTSHCVTGYNSVPKHVQSTHGPPFGQPVHCEALPKCIRSLRSFAGLVARDSLEGPQTWMHTCSVHFGKPSKCTRVSGTSRYVFQDVHPCYCHFVCGLTSELSPVPKHVQGTDFPCQVCPGCRDCDTTSPQNSSQLVDHNDLQMAAAQGRSGQDSSSSRCRAPGAYGPSASKSCPDASGLGAACLGRSGETFPARAVLADAVVEGVRLCAPAGGVQSLEAGRGPAATLNLPPDTPSAILLESGTGPAARGCADSGFS